MIHLFCPSKKLRLKANLKLWIDTISAVRWRDKVTQKIQEIWFRNKDNFQSAKIGLQKAISKNKKSFFQEKIEKNANNSKEVRNALKSLGMKSGKVNQSKIALKNDDAIQLNLHKMQISSRISTLI